MRIVYRSHQEVDGFDQAQRRRIAKKRGLIQLLAVGVVLAVALVLVTVGVLAASMCIRALKRSRERREWVEWVIRNSELDRRLTKIWKER